MAAWLTRWTSFQCMWVRVLLLSIAATDGMVWYGIVEFNVPLDTV